jgi:hypothetical protein
MNSTHVTVKVTIAQAIAVLAAAANREFIVTVCRM